MLLSVASAEAANPHYGVDSAVESAAVAQVVSDGAGPWLCQESRAITGSFFCCPAN
jgi:hypothetical protein